MKIRIVICLIAALFVFTGASVWEGSASVASGETLPRVGFYVATNSFPLNTVVNIVNLENGRSIPAIVTSRLDSPGLLAVISREAAIVIGLVDQSIGRVSMTRPPGPIASPRVRNNNNEPVLRVLGDGRQELDVGFLDNSALAENLWIAGSGGRQTEGRQAEAGLINEAAGNWPQTEVSGPGIAIAGNPNTAADGSTPHTGHVAADAAQEAPVRPHWFENMDFRFVPAEERPPTLPGAVISPQDIIPGIDRDNIGRDLSARDIEIAQNKGVIRDTDLDFDYLAEILSQIQTPAAVQAVEQSLFQRHLIRTLERGSFYVQIASFSREEQIETEIRRINQKYPLAVYNAGTSVNPVYRILLGPLNLGESGAMLQRFRSIGYTDAFVRRIP